MNWNIITVYPYWFWPLCLVLGAIFAWIVYAQSASKSLSKGKRYLLASIRMLSISILAFLLLGPMIKEQQEIIEEPIIILAQDNSESIRIKSDSLNIAQQYLPAMEKLRQQLGRNYQLENVLFGDQIKKSTQADFTDQETDFERLSAEIEARYLHRNIAAIILASDGNYNKGRSPRYLFKEFNFPIYTIALGDTSQQRDFKFTSIDYNRIVLKGNLFTIETGILANNLKGSVLDIDLFQGKKLVASQKYNLKSKEDFTKIAFQIKAEKKGTQDYRVLIKTKTLEGENLSKEVKAWVDVIEQKQQVLILADAPHPDISALKNAIEEVSNFEVEVSSTADFKGKTQLFDLIVLYQLPTKTSKIQSIIEAARQSKTNFLLILGESTDIKALNQLDLGFTFIGKAGVFEHVYPSFQPNFSLFSFPDKLKQDIEQFPPLYIPLLNINQSENTQVWISQKIGQIKTERPLLAFTEDEDRRIGLIAGESIWRWRMADYQNKQNHQAFNALIGKVLMYLSVRADRRPLRLNLPHEIGANEQLSFDAELYNESLEKVNQVPLHFILINENGEEFPYEMEAYQDFYRLNIGIYPAGLYKWQADCKLGDKKYQERGEILIRNIQKEQFDIGTNHSLLNQLSEESGGKIFYPDQISGMSKEIQAHATSKKLIHYQDSYLKFLDLRWYLILLLILFTIEWFIRKYNGLV